MSSLVYIKGNRKANTDEQKRELAGIAGVKFVKLRALQRVFGNSGFGIQGFQNVTINSGEEGGRVRVRAIYSKRYNRNGEHVDCSRGKLRFVGDTFNVGYAYVPDTPYNRRKLASCYYDAPYEIADEKVNTEVELVAKELFAEAQQKQEQEEVERDYRAELEDKQSEVEKLREELERAKKREKYKPDPVTSNIKESDRESTPEQQEEDRKIYGRTKQKAKYSVYNENKNLVEEMKKEQMKNNGTTRGWTMTKSYKKNIEPKVKSKTVEILKQEHPDTLDRISYGNNPDLDGDN